MIAVQAHNFFFNCAQELQFFLFDWGLFLNIVVGQMVRGLPDPFMELSLPNYCHQSNLQKSPDSRIIQSRLKHSGEMGGKCLVQPLRTGTNSNLYRTSCRRAEDSTSIEQAANFCRQMSRLQQCNYEIQSQSLFSSSWLLPTSLPPPLSNGFLTVSVCTMTIQIRSHGKKNRRNHQGC